MSDMPAGNYSSEPEQWRYPEPIQDLPGWLHHNWEWFDPSHSYRVLWPDRAHRADLDILIAGCGTNQAAVFAHTNPNANVVAVDVDQTSLNHQQYLKDTYGLRNLHLHRLRIEDLPSRAANFDLVVCTGVLHHLADPVAGMAALAQCLRPDGVIGAMVYAKYGRFGVEVLEPLIGDLELGPDPASLRVIKDAIAFLPAQHPLRTYLQMVGGRQSDALLVDTFLRGSARNYTVADCLDLVTVAGLAFRGWLFNASYHPHPLLAASRSFHPALQQLPRATLWSAMERINTTNACHFFMAGHTQQPSPAYTVDFSSAESLSYVPSWRMRCGLADGEIVRPDWRRRLNDQHLAFVAAIDGRRTIRQIAADVAHESSPRADVAKAETLARDLFHELWLLDFVAVTVNA